ncbi:MAG: hypothetical protein M0R75_15410 [Dehalococcoidia bacterium]|jgi:hypothetical protein|nr:hypothetical protein [Dehalococcoidia bacterium]
MTLAFTMLALAWVVAITPLRRLVESESVVAFGAAAATVLSLYFLNRLA